MGCRVLFVVLGLHFSLLGWSGDSNRLVITRALLNLRSAKFGDGFRVQYRDKFIGLRFFKGFVDVIIRPCSRFVRFLFKVEFFFFDRGAWIGIDSNGSGGGDPSSSQTEMFGL